MRRLAPLASLALGLLAACAAGPSRPGRVAAVPAEAFPTPESTPAEEAQVLDAVNRRRANAGLAPLRRDPALARAAAEHSREQHEHGYMGHGSPDPTRDELADRLRAAGYAGMRSAGEVVARGYPSPVSVVEAWMGSRGHRAILLDPALAQAGFARVGAVWTGNLARR